MKKYDLQYKMKNLQLTKNMNEISRAKILKKVGHNDEFLESAQQFYKTNNAKRESNIVKLRNPQIQLKIKSKDGELTLESNITKRSDSKITVDNVKRSVQRDTNNNLEYWRKETFKYQQQVFALERKNSELTLQNNKLKDHLKAKQVVQIEKTHNLNPQISIQQQRQIYKKKLMDIEKQIKMKCFRLQQLQIVLKVVSEKIKEHSPQLMEQLQIAPSLSFAQYISTLQAKQNQLFLQRQKESVKQYSLIQSIPLQIQEYLSVRPQ